MAQRWCGLAAHADQAQHFVATNFLALDQCLGQIVELVAILFQRVDRAIVSTFKNALDFLIDFAGGASLYSRRCAISSPRNTSWCALPNTIRPKEDEHGGQDALSARVGCL